LRITADQVMDLAEVRAAHARLLRLFINEQGTVDKAEVLRSTPPGLFDATALEAASRARFSPGYLAGVPVKSQVTFEVKYRALGSGAEAGGRTY